MASPNTLTAPDTDKFQEQYFLGRSYSQFRHKTSLVQENGVERLSNIRMYSYVTVSTVLYLYVYMCNYIQYWCHICFTSFA